VPSYIYILASKKKGTLYTGVTANLTKRVFEHKQAQKPSFTSRYGVQQLVYYEAYEDILIAIAREKEIKKWRRAWKIALIEKMNPCWHDLYTEIVS
jgi:putative endonuclease